VQGQLAHTTMVDRGRADERAGLGKGLATFLSHLSLGIEIGCLEHKVWVGGKRKGKGRGKRKCESEAASEVSEARVPRPEVLRRGVLGKRPSRRGSRVIIKGAGDVAAHGEDSLLTHIVSSRI